MDGGNRGLDSLGGRNLVVTSEILLVMTWIILDATELILFVINFWRWGQARPPVERLGRKKRVPVGRFDIEISASITRRGTRNKKIEVKS